MENFSNRPATLQVNRFLPLHSGGQVVLKTACRVELYDSLYKLSTGFSGSDKRVGVDLDSTVRVGVGRRALEHLDPNEIFEKSFVPFPTEFVDQSGLGEYQIALRNRPSRTEECRRQGDGYLAPTDLGVLGATSFGHLGYLYSCIYLIYIHRLPMPYYCHM